MAASSSAPHEHVSDDALTRANRRVRRGAPALTRPSGQRRDIQGLRALAVLLVITNHIWGWPGGGFLGVDVFFVISGFLIAGLLTREVSESGRISLGAFYLRRIRRILPLALLVLGVAYLWGQRVLSPMKAHALGTDALWAALMAANWRFAHVEADYFAQGDAPSAVEHYWSLAVEEQFYLLWPLALLLIAVACRGRLRPFNRVAGPLAATIAVASFGWALLVHDADRIGAYYSTFTRAWELAVGALLAFVIARLSRLPRALALALSLIGVAGIVVSASLVNSHSALPVPAAAGAVLATVCVLAAGGGRPGSAAGEQAPNPLLTNPVMRYLGDLSYALYLWHFVILTMLTAWWGDHASKTGWVTLALTFVAAVASHHLIELPIMRVGRSHAPATSRRGVLAGGIAAAMVAAAAALVATSNAGFLQPNRLPVTSSDAPVAADPGAQGHSAPSAAGASPSAQASKKSQPSTSAQPQSPSSAATIPLGSSGQAVQQALGAGLSLSSWPANITPQPAGQDGFNNPAVEACAQGGALKNPSGCSFGNASGPEIVIYGDSLAMGLGNIALASELARTHKITLVTQIGCSLTGINADYAGSAGWRTMCETHRAKAISYIKTHKPKTVLIMSKYGWINQLNSGARGSQAADEWRSAATDFVKQTKSSGTKLTYLPPPVQGIGRNDCYRPGTSPASCINGVPAYWMTARSVEQSVPGAAFVDTLHWYCVNDRCPMVAQRDGRSYLTKSDYMHLTYPFERTLASDLVYRLKEAGVINE